MRRGVRAITRMVRGTGKWVAIAAMVAVLAASAARAGSFEGWLALIDPRRASAHIDLHSAVANVAKQVGLRPEHLAVIVRLEAGTQPDPCFVGPAGEQGLAQVLPSTRDGMGMRADLLNPVQSLFVGGTYFKRQLERADSERLAFAAYNAGPKALRGSYPRSTERYVSRAVALLEKARSSSGDWRALLPVRRVPNTNSRMCRRQRP